MVNIIPLFTTHFGLHRHSIIFYFYPTIATCAKEHPKPDTNFEPSFEDVTDLKFGYKKFWLNKTRVELFVPLVKILRIPTDSSE